MVRYNLTHYIHIQASGRLVVEPKPFLPDYKDELYRTVLAFENPFDVQGLQIATTTYYDNSRLPDTDSYIPALRRTRRLPSSQRNTRQVTDVARRVRCLAERREDKRGIKPPF